MVTICHYLIYIAVPELKTWDLERVPSCAAPHCLRVLWVLDLPAALETGKSGALVLEGNGEAKGTKTLE